MDERMKSIMNDCVSVLDDTLVGVADNMFFAPHRSLARRKIAMYHHALWMHQNNEETRGTILEENCIGEPALVHTILSLEQELIDKFDDDDEFDGNKDKVNVAIQTLDSLYESKDVVRMLDFLNSGSVQANAVIQEHGMVLLYKMVMKENSVGSPIRSALVNANGIQNNLLRAGWRFTKQRPQLQRAVLAMLVVLPFVDSNVPHDNNNNDIGICTIYQRDHCSCSPCLMDDSILTLLHESNVLSYMGQAVKENWIQIDPCIEGSMDMVQMERSLARKQVIAMSAAAAASTSTTAAAAPRPDGGSSNRSTKMRKQYLHLRTCIATLLNDDFVCNERVGSFLYR